MKKTRKIAVMATVVAAFFTLGACSKKVTSSKIAPQLPIYDIDSNQNLNDSSVDGGLENDVSDKAISRTENREDNIKYLNELIAIGHLKSSEKRKAALINQINGNLLSDVELISYYTASAEAYFTAGLSSKAFASLRLIPAKYFALFQKNHAETYLKLFTMNFDKGLDVETLEKFILFANDNEYLDSIAINEMIFREMRRIETSPEADKIDISKYHSWPEAFTLFNGWIQLTHFNFNLTAINHSEFEKLSLWEQNFPIHTAKISQPRSVAEFKTRFQIEHQKFKDSLPIELDKGWRGYTGQKISVFLPLDSKQSLGHFGNTIKNSFESQVKINTEQGHQVPVFNFVDTTNINENEIFKKIVLEAADGAKLVIGPIQRNLVSALENSPELPIPTLALNIDDRDNKGPKNLYRLSVSPEDEIETMLDHAWANGKRSAYAYFLEDNEGRRLEKHFKMYWNKLGGQVSNSLFHNREKDQETGKDQESGETIIELMKFDTAFLSEATREEKELYFSTEKKKRKGNEFIITSASFNSMGGIIPTFLRSYDLSNIPIYAFNSFYQDKLSTSELYQLANSRKDTFQNSYIEWFAEKNISFFSSDIPWNTNKQNQISSMINPQDNHNDYRLRKIIALSIDAFNFIPFFQLDKKAIETKNFKNGKIGDLRLTENSYFKRTSTLFQFKEGKVVESKLWNGLIQPKSNIAREENDNFLIDLENMTFFDGKEKEKSFLLSTIDFSNLSQEKKVKYLLLKAQAYTLARLDHLATQNLDKIPGHYYSLIENNFFSMFLKYLENKVESNPQGDGFARLIAFRDTSPLPNRRKINDIIFSSLYDQYIINGSLNHITGPHELETAIKQLVEMFANYNSQQVEMEKRIQIWKEENKSLNSQIIGFSELDNFEKKFSQLPVGKVAVFLPTKSGTLPYSLIAKGILIKNTLLKLRNYYRSKNLPVPTFNFIETGRMRPDEIIGKITDLYKKDDTQLILGPLRRDLIEVLEKFENFGRPIITLDIHDFNHTSVKNLYRTGMLEHDDMNTILDHAWSSGKRKLFGLFSRSAQGKLNAQTAVNYWKNLGGQIGEIQYHYPTDSGNNNEEIRRTLHEMFNYQLSELNSFDLSHRDSRKSYLADVRNRRDGTEFLFMEGNFHKIALVANELEDFLEANDIKKYAINTFYDDFLENCSFNDLVDASACKRSPEIEKMWKSIKSIYSSEIPWLVDKDNAIRDQIETITHFQSGKSRKTIALGIDAYHLIPMAKYFEKQGPINFETGYASGSLTLNAKRVFERRSKIIEFRNGRPFLTDELPLKTE